MEGFGVMRAATLAGIRCSGGARGAALVEMSDYGEASSE